MRVFLYSILSMLVLLGPVHAQDNKKEWPPKGTLVVDAIVAVVDSEPITLYEFQRAAAPYVAKFRSENVSDDPAEQASQIKRIRDDVIESLIANKLIRQEAMKLDLKVTSEQVDAQLSQVKNSNGWDDEDLAGAVGRLGFDTLQDYRRHVSAELLKNRVIGIKVSSKIRIDLAEAKRMYRKKYGESGKVEERRLAHILLRVAELAPKPELEEARKKLQEVAQAIVKGPRTNQFWLSLDQSR
jgi:hypothetical protein